MKQTIATTLLALASTLVSTPAAAQQTSWQPNGPVTLILAYGAGGGHYALAQIMQARLSEELGQPIIIVPRPGGGGQIAAELISKANPDGRTLHFAGISSLTILPHLRKVSYDPQTLTPITLLVKMGFMLLTQPDNHELNTLQDVITQSQQRDLTYSHAGIGTVNSLVGHLLNAMTGAKLRDIGYKGGGPALLAAMAGETSLASGDTASYELIESGRLKAIATTMREREPRFPNVPAISETVPGYQVENWLSVVAPPNTPAHIAQRYNDVFVKVMTDPDIAARVRQLGMTPSIGTQRELADLIESDSQLWLKLITDQHIKIE